MFIQRLRQWVLFLADFAPSQEGHSETILNPSNSVKHVDHRLVVAEAIRVSNSCCEAIAKQLKSRVAFPNNQQFTTSSKTSSQDAWCYRNLRMKSRKSCKPYPLVYTCGKIGVDMLYEAQDTPLLLVQQTLKMA
ncbi:hypothetical protein SNOG_08607 [Parastagonospora nodorum SN15]|uniref:Uncharacterized protein n=1 Tax=Phaeosphaeria nodorum (strain SN15 / ATCC MYA-4574 / FGSC 10173) TaxID=321614 RepID=Q0UI07_PHANO|nr:hypothetical protein SNOG_08607 [Parastagonospora nodorum SN15]EAT83775.1 hypothetical protein SNOG_08607 [Parastagonospora nodorum SN15]